MTILSFTSHTKSHEIQRVINKIQLYILINKYKDKYNNNY